MNETHLKIISPFQKEVLFLDESELIHLEKIAGTLNTWQLVYTLLCKQAHRPGVSRPTHAYLARKKESYVRLIAKTVKQQAAQEHIIGLLGENGIPALVIKGTTIAQQIYHDENARNSCDIDLLVRDKDIWDVHEILSENKYKRLDPSPLSFVLLRLHHATYYPHDNFSDSPLEIHWNFSIPGFFKLSSEQIWQGTTYDEKGKLTLNPEMTLVLLLMHHHRHAFNNFRNLVDLFWAFYRYERVIDWEKIAEKIEEIGLVKTSYLTLCQIKSTWPKDTLRLQGFNTFKAKIEQNVDAKPLLNRLAYHLSNFDNQKFTIKNKLIYRLALDSWQVVTASFFKSIVPPPRVIKSLYHDTDKSNLTQGYIRYYYWRFF